MAKWMSGVALTESQMALSIVTLPGISDNGECATAALAACVYRWPKIFVTQVAIVMVFHRMPLVIFESIRRHGVAIEIHFNSDKYDFADPNHFRGGKVCRLTTIRDALRKNY